MAMCSYQTLARYHDDRIDSRTPKIRTLDDIRVSQRQALLRSRFRFKSLKMLQNRRSFSAQYLDLDQDDTLTPDSPQQHDELDSPPSALSRTLCQSDIYNYDNDSEYTPGWGSEHTASSSDWSTPSPTWSSTPSTCSTHNPTTLTVTEQNIPAYLLETPDKPKRTGTPPSSSQESATSKHMKSYKQRASHSPRLKLARQYQEVISDIQIIRNTIHATTDSAAIDRIVLENWNTISLSLEVYDQEVVINSIELLQSLLLDRCISAPTMTHMLQHGLIYKLKDCRSRINGGSKLVTKLLATIARSIPASIPYMIELCSGSGLLKDLEAVFPSECPDERVMILEFYYLITETMLTQIYSNSPIKPLLPEILLITGDSKQTQESYSPLATCQRCLTPLLILGLVDGCLKRTALLRKDLIGMALLVFANAIKLLHILSNSGQNLPQNHREWMVSVLCGFRDSQIESKLSIFIKGLQRTVQASSSSEHSSQGFNVDTTASEVMDQCQQFIAFFRQFHQPLINDYGYLMNLVGTIVRKPLVDSWA